MGGPSAVTPVTPCMVRVLGRVRGTRRKCCISAQAVLFDQADSCFHFTCCTKRSSKYRLRTSSISSRADAITLAYATPMHCVSGIAALFKPHARIRTDNHTTRVSCRLLPKHYMHLLLPVLQFFLILVLYGCVRAMRTACRVQCRKPKHCDRYWNVLLDMQHRLLGYTSVTFLLQYYCDHSKHQLDGLCDCLHRLHGALRTIEWLRFYSGS
jgi:hypothetical protein